MHSNQDPVEPKINKDKVSFVLFFFKRTPSFKISASPILSVPIPVHVFPHDGSDHFWPWAYTPENLVTSERSPTLCGAGEAGSIPLEEEVAPDEQQVVIWVVGHALGDHRKVGIGLCP